MIVLATYYEFFIQCKSCDMMKHELQQATFVQLMKLTDLEKVALTFLAAGPQVHSTSYIR